MDPLTLLRIADKLLTPKFSLWLIQPLLFLKESALAPHLVNYFALNVVFNLGGGSMWTVMSHTVFSGTRYTTVTPGPWKAPSLKAWHPLSPSFCLKSKASHPLIPQLGGWQTTPGKKLMYENSINLMMYIIVCATCSTNKSIQLC